MSQPVDSNHTRPLQQGPRSQTVNSATADSPLLSVSRQQPAEPTVNVLRISGQETGRQFNVKCSDWRARGQGQEQQNRRKTSPTTGRSAAGADNTQSNTSDNTYSETTTPGPSSKASSNKTTSSAKRQKADRLQNRGQRQQHADMNKQDEAGGGSDDGQTKTATTAQAVTDIMKHPEFGPGQLPGLWQQITEPDGTLLSSGHRDRWSDGITVMWQRCETYPQHAELAGTLFGMPDGAWHVPEWDLGQQSVDELLQQATSAQLLQAIEHEQHHPRKRWSISYHILSQADIAQLTGQVIEQLKWDVAMTWLAVADSLTLEKPGNEQWRHVSDHIRQHLLDGDNDAWDVFHGIIGGLYLWVDQEI